MVSENFENNKNREDIDAQYKRIDVLPDHLIEIGIEDLLDGEVVFITPFSIWVDMDGKMFLPKRTTFKYESGGTVECKIMKDQGTFLVFEETLGDKKFSKTSQPKQFGVSKEDCLPVVLLSRK